MGGKSEIPNFMSGAQGGREGGGQPDDGMSQLKEAIGALSQNQRQLGTAHAITQQAMMFLANIMINEMDKPDHVKEAYLTALGRIMQGENPQEVQEDLRKDLTNPGIITP